MAGIIKNQLVKHLSKFTRNLKPEQISLDVLKGNSKLQFIEINEEVLTDILELPSWLRIKRAYCTGVTVNVPWTRLKSSPIQIFIDEINVEVELSSATSGKRGENPLGNLVDNSSYGFADKIVENMSLYINTVEINFDSDAFGGSFMLQRLSVESRSPGWAQVQDLRQTRITCPTTNRTLMYKQLSWHLLRIEASAKTTKDEQRSKINAPLRLITSGGKIRIALKKSSIDGSVIHARIQTILDDILWVATLPQLRSAISFASYIMSLVQESQKDMVVVPTPAGQFSKTTSIITPGLNASPSVFKAFYFDQTSYHLHVKKIDLHLCDDAHSSNCYPPNWNIESGAMQVTLYQVLIDVYPKALATSDRSTWMRYTTPNTFTNWMHGRLLEQLNSMKQTIKEQTLLTRLERCWPQLMGFFVVVRMYDLTVQCVSDMNTKKDALKSLFFSERHLRSLPNDQYIVHFEFANYYHPMTDTLPVPKSAAYLQLGPFSLTFDERTLRWCLYVAHYLQSAIEDGQLNVPTNPDIQTPDIRIDLIMPKIVIPFPKSSSDARLPHRLIVSMSTLSISSCPFEMNQHTKFKNLHEVQKRAQECSETFSTHLQSVADGCVPEGCERFYLRTSPVWVDTDHGPNTKGLPLVFDISFVGAIIINPNFVSIFAEPSEGVTVMIDHFQFIQITRLSAQLSAFFDMLSLDQKHFNNSKVSNAPVVSFLIGIEKIQVDILLSMGAMPSPYDSCPAVSDINNSYMERLSDITSTTPRSSTPNLGRKIESQPNALIVPRNNVPRNSSLEAFPEFPPPAAEFDASSFIDETGSIATSVEDEGNFEYDVAASDDPFGIPDVAEEAVLLDENILNDRIYKSIMAKVGNVLVIELAGISVLGSVENGNLQIKGEVNSINLSYKLAIVRQEAKDILKKSESRKVSFEDPSIVNFTLSAPSDDPTSYLNVGINGLQAILDDEIITHLSAFALDDQVSDNKINLNVNLTNSGIQIIDRKKKKPLKLKITSLTIEQEED